MFRWYVINTYSGHENKVKHNLEHRVQTRNLQHVSVGSTGDEITPVQCDIMFTRALEESVISP